MKDKISEYLSRKSPYYKNLNTMHEKMSPWVKAIHGLTTVSLAIVACAPRKSGEIPPTLPPAPDAEATALAAIYHISPDASLFADSSPIGTITTIQEGLSGSVVEAVNTTAKLERLNLENLLPVGFTAIDANGNSGSLALMQDESIKELNVFKYANGLTVIETGYQFYTDVDNDSLRFVPPGEGTNVRGRFFDVFAWANDSDPNRSFVGVGTLDEQKNFSPSFTFYTIDWENRTITYTDQYSDQEISWPFDDVPKGGEVFVINVDLRPTAQAPEATVDENGVSINGYTQDENGEWMVDKAPLPEGPISELADKLKVNYELKWNEDKTNIILVEKKTKIAIEGFQIDPSDPTYPTWSRVYNFDGSEIKIPQELSTIIINTNGNITDLPFPGFTYKEGEWERKMFKGEKALNTAEAQVTVINDGDINNRTYNHNDDLSFMIPGIGRPTFKQNEINEPTNRFFWWDNVIPVNNGFNGYDLIETTVFSVRKLEKSPYNILMYWGKDGQFKFLVVDVIAYADGIPVPSEWNEYYKNHNPTGW